MSIHWVLKGWVPLRLNYNNLKSQLFQVFKLFGTPSTLGFGMLFAFDKIYYYLFL